jgi:hypothetical protein
MCHPLLLCSGVRGWSCSNAITCLWQHDDSNQAELQFALGYMPVVDSCIYSMGDVWRSREILGDIYPVTPTIRAAIPSILLLEWPRRPAGGTSAALWSQVPQPSDRGVPRKRVHAAV